MDLEVQYFECQCFTDEHMLKFTYDPDDGELFATVYLRAKPFFSRLWCGVTYIFGYTSQYGHFSSWILKENDIPRLKELLLKAESFSNTNEPI